MSTQTHAVTVLRPAPRLTSAPCAEPPFDDRGPAPRAAAAAVQGTLALTFTLPSGVPATPGARLRLVPPPAPRPPSSGGRPDAHAWAAMLARGIVEVLTGDRPVTQLVHWTAPPVYAELTRRATRATSLRSAERVSQSRPTARRVHVCPVSERAVEVTTAVHGKDRARALAFRLEFSDGRWLCTELLIG